MSTYNITKSSGHVRHGCRAEDSREEPGYENGLGIFTRCGADRKQSIEKLV